MDEQSQGMQGPPVPQFQPQKALRPDMGYNTLANFRIEKKIGRGQFSEVYRAACLLDGVPVALKKVQIFDLMDAKARADCIKEIDLLKQLNHPNVIKYYASFIEDNELNIVLELADAGDLSRMIKWVHLITCLQREYTKMGTTSSLTSGPLAVYCMSVICSMKPPLKLTCKCISFIGSVLQMAALQSPFYGDKMNLYSLCKKIEQCDYPPLPSDHYSEELRQLVNMCINPDPEKRPDIAYVYDVAKRMHACTASA
ncbi:serine/threonine-protein kinase Nek7 isoform X4 [Bubalus bubalis]|uniref:serine/threonine-protein kinase Nek7 isoform X4 n=1 Tax=Bubalus bubalis TaxID=89462 RepID=UPI000DBC95ED|nr:serine/threonine-protein kinase Nek7 isoform X4 [Bubalus bubalis]